MVRSEHRKVQPKKAKARQAAKSVKARRPPARPTSAKRVERSAPASRSNAAAQSGARQLEAPQMLGQRLALEKGHYAVRHLGFTPGQVPRDGLPMGLVEVLTGNVTLSSGGAAHRAPSLRDPNDTVLINVGSGGGEILVVCLNHAGEKGPGFRFILSPITLPQVAQDVPAAARSVPASVSPLPVRPPIATPSPRTIAPIKSPAQPRIVAMGHSEILGDVNYKAGDWIGGVGNVALRLEGLVLRLEDAPPGLDIEYAIVNRQGAMIWSRQGALAGSRGKAEPLFGFAAKVAGAEGANWRVAYTCRFAGDTTPVSAQDGKACRSQVPNAHVTSVQVRLERKSVNDQPDLAINTTPPHLDFSDVKILAHIEGEGDRIFKWGEWVGTPGSRRAIEGIQIIDNLPNKLTLEAINGGDALKRWTPLLQFVGTRGERKALSFSAFRITGDTSSSFNLETRLKYVADPTVYKHSSKGDYLPPFNRGRLEAIQFAIT
jgi:hypothetical protein